MHTVLLLYLKGRRESAGGEERMPPAYYCYVKAFVTKYTVLLLYLKGRRESAGGEERMPPAYYLLRQGICDEVYGALSTALLTRHILEDKI